MEISRAGLRWTRRSAFFTPGLTRCPAALSLSDAAKKKGPADAASPGGERQLLRMGGGQLSQRGLLCRDRAGLDGCGFAAFLGQESRQGLSVSIGWIFRCGIGGRRAQRLRQPARAREETLGLARHVRLLQMVDQLRRLLALRLADRFEDAGSW